MALPSYHTHTLFCDGKNTPEEMILAAIKRGMPELGFSCHARMPFNTDWCITENGEKEYFETLTALKEKYKDNIKIYIGIEQDANAVPVSYPYDYIIGSVHGIWKGKDYLDVDLSPLQVRENVEKYYGGDPYTYVEEYYSLVADIYETTKCDIIGHFDLVTKFLDRDNLFSEEHPRYIAARDKALAVLLKTPAVFEINTGGIYRGYRKVTYPNMEMIEKIAESGKPFVINADSHNSESVDFMLCDVATALDKRNIKYLTNLNEILNITRK